MVGTSERNTDTISTGTTDVKKPDNATGMSADHVGDLGQANVSQDDRQRVEANDAGHERDRNRPKECQQIDDNRHEQHTQLGSSQATG
jgi:hypothetical protein